MDPGSEAVTEVITVDVPGGALAVDHLGLDWVTSLVLVDGGLPMASPPGLTPQALPAIFRDRLARLDREWATAGDYAGFFVATTAPLLDPADPLRR